MGQGTESCGGYEIHYDPYAYEESEGFTVWTGRDGAAVNVSDMSTNRLYRTVQMLRNKGLDDPEIDDGKWCDWIDCFNQELARRKQTKEVKPKAPTRGTKIERTCECGNKFWARQADVNRGWGKYCSKSCKARFN